MSRLIEKNPPDRLVLHRSLLRSVYVDVTQQEVRLVSRYLLFRKTKAVPFDEIEEVWLDHQEFVVATDEYGQHEGRSRWAISLTLKDGQTLALAQATTDRSAEAAAMWDHLAARIADLTGKELVRTPSVPGGPHTFVASIDRILQQRLAQSPLGDRAIRLRSGQDGGLEVVIGDTIYCDLEQVEDQAVRDLIQGAIDEWESRE